MTMESKQKQLVTTARVTGVWYLVMAISGILGFMIFHPRIFIADNPGKTLMNLTDQESLPRIRLLLELAIVASQALAAAWFYKLFRDIDKWAAWAVGVWGMMNAAAVMVSATAMGAALDVAGSVTPAFQEKELLIQLLDSIITGAWGVGSLFFGLWLIPMGRIVIRSQRMPVWLGRTLVIGGISYLLSTFIHYAGLENPYLEALAIPATIGEFWMIGYLLVYGIRPPNG